MAYLCADVCTHDFVSDIFVTLIQSETLHTVKHRLAGSTSYHQPHSSGSMTVQLETVKPD